MVVVADEGCRISGSPFVALSDPTRRYPLYKAKIPSILGGKWRRKANVKFPGGGSMKFTEK